MRRPIIALWCVPRSGSTAFERMMIERGDHEVLDEPFSAFYYFGPARLSPRFEETLPRSSWDQVVEDLTRTARRSSVFVKDMAYHLGPHADAEFLENFVNTFLIRTPRRALPSLGRKWPDFTDDETGYRAQHAAYEAAASLGDEPPAVVDYDDLLADPPGIVSAWCDAVGIPFRPEALSWEPGIQPQWKLWRDWYERAATSTGFAAPVDGPPPEPTDDRLREAIVAALPFYDEMRSVRITPASTRP